jgi:hypothetical protein
MSLSQLPADDPERIAAARPWRQRAWERVPGWMRMALVGLLALLLLHIAVGIRMWFGIQDPPEVVAIRGPGRHIIIPEINKLFRNPLEWLEAAPIGLRGASGKDVTAVRLDEHATDELIAHIAKHFPNVHSLYFSRGNITSQGLMALKDCPQLWSLDVSDTEVDDGLGELLPHLPRLNWLNVNNTNVGDEFARMASRHERLDYCPIEGTNITKEAAAEWQASRPKTRIQTDFDRYGLKSVIRWDDGEVSRRYSGKYSLGKHGPKMTDGRWAGSSTTSSTGLRADQLRWVKAYFTNDKDGEYQYRLKLDNIEAEPADFTVKDGVPTPNQIEFRMPVTRAEAEQQATKER